MDRNVYEGKAVNYRFSVSVLGFSMFTFIAPYTLQVGCDMGSTIEINHHWLVHQLLLSHSLPYQLVCCLFEHNVRLQLQVLYDDLFVLLYRLHSRIFYFLFSRY